MEGEESSIRIKVSSSGAHHLVGRIEGGEDTAESHLDGTLN
jgi:hypothetical protein